MKYAYLLALVIIFGCAKKPAQVVSVGRSLPALAQPASKIVSAEIPALNIFRHGGRVKDVIHMRQANATTFVYFDFGADIPLPDQKFIAERFKPLRGSPPLHVVGYADTSGSAKYNLALSTRRACKVAALIPRATCEGRGETVQFGEDANNRCLTIKADATAKKK